MSRQQMEVTPARRDGLSGIQRGSLGAAVILEGNGLTLAQGTLQSQDGGPEGSLTLLSPLCVGCGLFLLSCQPAGRDKS